MKRRGLFITFEGIEGTGKTTQVRLAALALRRRHVDVVVTRQPGGTATGRRLRRILLHAACPLDARTELLLMVADRRQHLTELIEPALSGGAVVLCDRYADASRAYQGAGRGLGVALVDELHRRLGCRAPDRTYLFDCPVPVALARLLTPGRTLDRIERERRTFHERVRRAYRAGAREDPERIRVLDARLPIAVLGRLVLSDLEGLLAR